MDNFILVTTNLTHGSCSFHSDASNVISNTVYWTLYKKKARTAVNIGLSEHFVMGQIKTAYDILVVEHFLKRNDEQNTNKNWYR